MERLLEGGKIDMIESLYLEIIYNDEVDEPYYTIRCTDQDDNAIEIYGFDTVYNSKEEAQVRLNNILNKLKKEVK